MPQTRTLITSVRVMRQMCGGSDDPFSGAAHVSVDCKPARRVFREQYPGAATVACVWMVGTSGVRESNAFGAACREEVEDGKPADGHVPPLHHRAVGRQHPGAALPVRCTACGRTDSRLTLTLTLSLAATGQLAVPPGPHFLSTLARC